MFKAMKRSNMKRATKIELISLALQREIRAVENQTADCQHDRRMLATKGCVVVPGAVSVAKETILAEYCVEAEVCFLTSPFWIAEVREATFGEVDDADMCKDGMGNWI